MKQAVSFSFCLFGSWFLIPSFESFLKERITNDSHQSIRDRLVLQQQFTLRLRQLMHAEGDKPLHCNMINSRIQGMYARYKKSCVECVGAYMPYEKIRSGITQERAARLTPSLLRRDAAQQLALYEGKKIRFHFIRGVSQPDLEVKLRHLSSAPQSA